MNATPQGPAEPPAASRGRVLVVEDDQDTAFFLTHVLETRGQFEVAHTADPVDALAFVAESPWDLVITDLELPVMSGLELIGALRSLSPMLPILLITANEAAARGADCPVLVKPLRVDELIGTATALINVSNP